MRTLVEIGCGDDAGPYFDGVDQHIITDTNKAKVLMSAKYGQALNPIFGDATHLPLKSASADLVLARNILGDPLLGVSENSRRMYSSLRGIYMQDGDFSRLEELMDGVNKVVKRTKDRIIIEATRILVSGGTLIAVEQSTPFIAEDYLGQLSQEDSSVIADMSIAKIRLSQIAPESYVHMHSYNNIQPETWALTKR